MEAQGFESQVQGILWSGQGSDWMVVLVLGLPFSGSYCKLGNRSGLGLLNCSIWAARQTEEPDEGSKSPSASWGSVALSRQILAGALLFTGFLVVYRMFQ